MARRKIRNYPNKEYYENYFNEYFITHHDDVIADMVERTGFNSLDELHDAEFKMYFGLDCGFTYYIPYDSKMSREWKLDNYDDKLYGIRESYPTQSITLQEIQFKKALADLGLQDVFYVYSRLD